MNSTRFLFFTFLILISPCVLKAQYDVTYESLLDEMVNLKRLTYLPENEYRAVQFSSYDRRSTSPNEAGWYANSDGFGNEPIPGFAEVLKEPDESGIGEYLICDVKQPGVILRLWTARIEGNVRVYIDDISSPVFEGKAVDFFWNAHKVLTGKELLDEVFLQYHALYLPVSFANRLRIEWIGDLKKLHFYHVGLRLYGKNVEVEPFSKETLDSCAEKLQQVTKALTNDNLKPDKQTKLEENVIHAGEKKMVWESEGPGAIDKLQIKADAVNAENLLRKCVLSIYFDDSSIPQVHAPLGDFFGAAPGINPYNSLPFSVNEEGLMESRFLMPFQKNVKVEIDNLAGFDAKISIAVETSDYRWDEGESMHFRCRWKMDHDVTASREQVKDYAYLLALGKGRLAGIGTYAYNPSSAPASYGNWWGEGDEKIFVDNNNDFSFFGTGSEDYYNYSWSSPRIFYYPYCGQPRNDGPGNRGYVANFRWHILDDIPFDKSLAFYMELFHHEKAVPHFSYGRIAYYYALPGTIDDYQQISSTDVKDFPYLSWSPKAYRGSAGYRFVNAEDVVVSQPSLSTEEGKLWAGGELLVWNPEKKNEQLKFVINQVKEVPEKKIVFTMAKTPMGGEFSVIVNGKPVSVNQNTENSLYQESRTVLRNFSTEPIKLKKGENEIVFINNSDATAKKIGVDFIWIPDLETN